LGSSAGWDVIYVENVVGVPSSSSFSGMVPCYRRGFLAELYEMAAMAGYSSNGDVGRGAKGWSAFNGDSTGCSAEINFIENTVAEYLIDSAAIKVVRMTSREIADILSRTLSPGRYRHTMAVVRWADRLSVIHGVDRVKSRLAAVLHDCAKEISSKSQWDIIRRNAVKIPDPVFIQRHRMSGVLHAYVAAFLACRDFGVSDRDVLSAIRAHTLGAPRMSLLAKLLFVADFSSPDRRYTEAAAVRRSARRDLNAAFRDVLRFKIKYSVEDGFPLHPVTVKLWNEVRQ
jgi:predicted HD superfamily hydrolase involved in NAD metabolism